MFNNSALLASLDGSQIDSGPSRQGTPRDRLPSELCLPERLPTTAFLEREGQQLAPRAELRQLLRTPSPPESPQDEKSFLQDPEPPRSPPKTFRERATSFIADLAAKRSTSTGSESHQWKEPEPFEIFRAVERKDLAFLVEVRDRSFASLLRHSAGTSPLIHCMRIGKSHEDVAIVLLGAFSRWVNNLEDEDMDKPMTRKLLKALRHNLKAAINFGLQVNQKDLVASFLQALVMSEGDRWVWKQVEQVAAALLLGTAGKPVELASSAVRAFATRQLVKADLIAAVEDYIANATADLLMLAAWSIASEKIPNAEPIPACYFARDDRVQRVFQDRLFKHKSALASTGSKRLRWQIRVLEKVLEGRADMRRTKIQILAQQLDEGEGI